MTNLNVGFAKDLGVSPSAIQTFYQSNWKRRIALSDDAFYRWQFVDNPVNEGLDECIVATVGSEVAGVMGSGSRRFWLNGRERSGAELTTWVVSEKHRGKGVGPEIVRFLQNKYEVLLGAGITADALPVYLRTGFHYLRFLPRLLRILDLSAIEEYSYVEPLGKKLAKQRAPSLDDIDGGYAEIELQPGVIDEIFRTFAATHNLFDRGAKSFSWRYSSHPYFEYDKTCLAGRSGALILIVTRTDDLPNGSKVLRVMDMIGDDAMYSTAVTYIDQLCVRQGFSAADFFCTTAFIQAALMAKGWFSVLDEPFIQFPHLFSPMELRNPPTTSLIYWAKDDTESLLDMSRLYVTKGDTDLDRPTMETLEES